MSPIAFFFLALLLLAHAASDRLSIAETTARRRASIPLLASHALQVGLLSGLGLLFAYSRLVFAPQATVPNPVELGVLLAAVALGHFGLDWLHFRVDSQEPREAQADVADQLLHLGVLVLAVSLLARAHPEWHRLAAGDLVILGQSVEIATFGRVTCIVALLALATVQGLRTEPAPPIIARAVALRCLCVLLAAAGPLWLAVLLCGGVAGWRLRYRAQDDGWLHVVGISLMGFAIRFLQPA